MTKQQMPPEDDSFEEDEGKLLEAIKRMRSLLEEEKFLRIRKDDNFFLRYLRSSKYNPQAAVEKMKTYYTLKCQHPEWYITKESISSFKSELANHLYYLLEDRDRFGKRIFVNKLGMIDTSKTTMAKQSQLQDFFLESILDEEETQKCGLSIIVDLKSFSWTLLKWLTPTNICIAVKKIESLPLKQIEFHVVNTSALLNAAVKLIWPFLSAKTKENIHFHHENWPSLHKTIDPGCLPRQYGGTKDDINVEKLLEIVPGNEEWLSVQYLPEYHPSKVLPYKKTDEIYRNRVNHFRHKSSAKLLINQIKYALNSNNCMLEMRTSCNNYSKKRAVYVNN